MSSLKRKKKKVYKREQSALVLAWKLIHTSLNSSLWATASKHSCPVLSTESVNSTNSALSSWIRVTRQLLLETVYLRVLLSFKPNGKGMFHTSSSSLSPEKLFSSLFVCECSESWSSSSAVRSGNEIETSQTNNKTLQTTGNTKEYGTSIHTWSVRLKEMPDQTNTRLKESL